MKILASVFLMSTFCFGSIIGVSTHPMQADKHMISTEFVNDFSSEQSYGMQGKYLHRFSKKFGVDGGVRVLKSDFAAFLVSATYELYPDYGYQPMISVKGFYEFESISGKAKNYFGISPILSKGLSFWDIPAYTYIAAPVGMRLDYDSEDSEFVSELVVGMTGHLPFEDLDRIIANLEAGIGLNNSATKIALGFSLKFK